MNTDGQAYGPHSDLTYRVIEDATLEGTDLRQCLFTGAVFRRTVFKKVNFRRSDFDAARFEGCRFIECDLSIDMRSTLFVETEFTECTLGTAFITDCSFGNCRFNGIHFDDCAISHNDIDGCSFDKSSLTQSTFVHNTVRKSTFTATNMGDCTFLYVVMTLCTFFDCSMNIESVGMIYGLSVEDIQNFRYVHLGVEQPIPESREFVSTLLQQYLERRWRIGVAVMRLNFKLASPLYTFHQYLSETDDTFVAGTPLNREEMLFVAKLMTELSTETRLPLAACFDVSRWCAAAAAFAQENATLDIDRTNEVLRELATRAFTLTQHGLEILERSDAGRLLETGLDSALLARFDFIERPSIDLPDLMTIIAVSTGLSIQERSSTRRAYEGSWTEYVQTTMLSLAAMRVFLYFINGVLYDLAEARARITTLTRNRMPKEFLDLALRPQAPISASLVGPLKAIAGQALAGSWLNDPKLGGLDSTNVKAVKVIDDLETHTNDVARR